jgi:hypothetical protein
MTKAIKDSWCKTNFYFFLIIHEQYKKRVIKRTKVYQSRLLTNTNFTQSVIGINTTVKIPLYLFNLGEAVENKKEA